MRPYYSRPSTFGRFARTADEAFGSSAPMLERTDAGDKWVLIACLVAVVVVVIIGCFGGTLK